MCDKDWSNFELVEQQISYINLKFVFAKIL